RRVVGHGQSRDRRARGHRGRGGRVHAHRRCRKRVAGEPGRGRTANPCAPLLARRRDGGQRPARRSRVSVADVNGARLWYELAGDGPAVVFVHEGIGDSRLWDDQWAEASVHFRAVRYDQRGFGRSDLPGGPFSYAGDLRALLDRLEISHAALVGGSLGADAATQLAILEPERVTALVVAPPGVVGAERSQLLRAFSEAEEAAWDRDDVDETVRLNLDLWLAGPRRSLDAVN